MRAFNLLNNEILIINDKFTYKDTEENFTKDSGDSFEVNFIFYDDIQRHTCIDGELGDYPNETFEGYINNIHTYLKKKQDREAEETVVPEKTARDLAVEKAIEISSNLDSIQNKFIKLSLQGKDVESLKTEYINTMSQIDDEVATVAGYLVDEWDGNGVVYATGDYVRYNNVVYKVLQGHTSQTTWTPTDAPSLFAKVLVSFDGEPLDWQQPESTNPYMKGDKVLYNGHCYQSTIDNNVWSPDAYTAGWNMLY